MSKKYRRILKKVKKTSTVTPEQYADAQKWWDNEKTLKMMMISLMKWKENS